MLKKKYNNIYFLKRIDDLDKFSDNKHYWKYILYYYILINDYDRIYKFIVEKKSNDLNDYNINILNYYLCLYYINKKDVYNAEKMYYKLDDIYKIKIDISKCKYSYELNNIFDEKIRSNFKYSKLYKEYGNTLDFLYLNNFLREQYYFNNKLNKKIIYKLKKILKQNELSIADIEYLCSIISVTYYYYTLYFKDDNYPIDFDLLKKIVYKLTNNIDKYNEVIGNYIIKYNDLIVLGYRTLITIDNDVEHQKEYLDNINSFIENHESGEYNKFINKLSKQIKNGKQNMNDFLINIKKILAGNFNGEILHLIYIYCINSDSSKEILDFYNKLNSIDSNNNDLLFGKEILKFWTGGKFDLSYLKENVIIDDLTRLIIEFDNKEISYSDFIIKLQNINNIDCFFVLNWNRLAEVFKDCNYKWLEIILKKCNNINWKTEKYLLKIYNDILNYRKGMFLDDFVYLDNIITSKIDKIIFKVLSVLVHLLIYNDYNEEVVSNIQSILKNKQSSNLDLRVLESFIISVVIYSINHEKRVIEIEELKSLVIDKLNGNKKILCLLAIYFLDRKELENDFYISALKYIYNIYDKNSSIEDISEFSLISILASKSLVKKESIKAKNQDIVYYDDKKLVVLETDVNDLYQEFYDKLKIIKVQNLLNCGDKTNMLEVMLERIYFENIEKYNAGKKISLPSNLKGKDLIIELLRAVGYDEDQKKIKQIKEGTIINGLWLNIFTLHQYMKDIKSKKDKKFSNSINGLVGNQKKIIHITSLVLLAKLGIVDRLVKNPNYKSTGYVYNEIDKMKNSDHTELIDGIIEENVCYDDYLNDIYNTLLELDEMNQIEYVSSANILGFKEEKYINDFDLEFMKLMTTYDKESFIIITEDPFYFKTDVFNNISYGTYSLLIDMFYNSVISSEELYNLTKALDDLNYNFIVGKDIYNYLISKSDDMFISNILDIINNYY